MILQEVPVQQATRPTLPAPCESPTGSDLSRTMLALLCEPTSRPNILPGPKRQVEAQTASHRSFWRESWLPCVGDETEQSSSLPMQRGNSAVTAPAPAVQRIRDRCLGNETHPWHPRSSADLRRRLPVGLCQSHQAYATRSR